MLVHQLGSFTGIWLGGVLAQHTGSDIAFWWIDVAFALGAALLAAPAWERTRPAARTPRVQPA